LFVRSSSLIAGDQLQDLWSKQAEVITMSIAEKFSEVFRNLAAARPAGSPAPIVQQGVSTIQAPPPPAPEVASPSEPNEEGLGLLLRPPIRCRHNLKSASAIYNEYKGKGEFEGVPIVGGFEAMDCLYKTKWRVGDGGYQKAYSRVLMICKAVEG
jgi:hypothetical protein